MSIPYIIEQGPNNQERAYDLFSRLLKDRIIFVKGEIHEGFADAIVGQLLFLESDSSSKDIFMYINSPGGAMDEMYGIFDAMTYIKPDVVTMAYGKCMSAGSFLVAAGAKGKRYALPNTDIMIHEMSAGTRGKYHDIKNYTEHLDKTYEKMAKYYHEFTGQPIEKIREDMKRDFYMSAEEAKEYGLIDKIQYNRE
jgi:ATP-dependent Clp protease protease subunit